MKCMKELADKEWNIIRVGITDVDIIGSIPRVSDMERSGYVLYGDARQCYVLLGKVM